MTSTMSSLTNMQPPASFLTCPKEIRDRIYADLLNSGCTNILLVSHSITEDIRFALERQCLDILIHGNKDDSWQYRSLKPDQLHFKIFNNISYTIDFSRVSSQTPMSDTSQILGRYGLDLKSPNDNVFPSRLDVKAAIVTPSKSCTITLTNFHISMDYFDRARAALRSIPQLNRFRSVKVVALAGEFAKADGSIGWPGSGSDRGIWRMMTRARNYGMYKMVKTFSEPDLGPCVWHRARWQEHSFLEFHPRE